MIRNRRITREQKLNINKVEIPNQYSSKSHLLRIMMKNKKNWKINIREKQAERKPKIDNSIHYIQQLFYL